MKLSNIVKGLLIAVPLALLMGIASLLLGDRTITEHLPILRSGFVRFLVVFAVFWLAMLPFRGRLLRKRTDADRG